MKSFVLVVSALFISGVAGADEAPNFSPESAKAILRTQDEEQILFFAENKEEIVAKKQQHFALSDFAEVTANLQFREVILQNTCKKWDYPWEEFKKEFTIPDGITARSPDDCIRNVNCHLLLYFIDHGVAEESREMCKKEFLVAILAMKGAVDDQVQVYSKWGYPIPKRSQGAFFIKVADGPSTKERILYFVFITIVGLLMTAICGPSLLPSRRPSP